MVSPAQTWSKVKTLAGFPCMMMVLFVESLSTQMLSLQSLTGGRTRTITLIAQSVPLKQLKNRVQLKSFSEIPLYALKQTLLLIDYKSIVGIWD